MVGMTCAGALFAAPWVVVIAMVLLMIRWRAWEVVGIALLIDMLYIPIGGIFGVPFIITPIALLMLWGFEPLREHWLLPA